MKIFSNFKFLFSSYSARIQRTIRPNLRDSSYNLKFQFYLNALTVYTFFNIGVNTHKKIKCLENLEKSKLDSRVSSIQYPSNKPIEDRWTAYQLKNLNGYIAMVIDGHIGWQLAEYVRDNLAQEIDRQLLLNKYKKYADNDEYIRDCLNLAFDEIENRYLEFARAALPFIGCVPSKCGAAALVALIHEGKLYAANSGDCKGLIMSEGENGVMNYQKINREFNAMSKKEQERLKKEFPKDEDIFVCDNPNECYVKDKLQLTRCFGDFYLKYPEFNNPKDLGREYKEGKRIINFNGPYITHKPEIRIFELKKNDKFLVLSTDGMWDQMNKQEVTSVVQANKEVPTKIPLELLNKAFSIACSKVNKTEEEVKSIPQGKRRDIHDDMTILLVDLSIQT